MGGKNKVGASYSYNKCSSPPWPGHGKTPAPPLPSRAQNSSQPRNDYCTSTRHPSRPREQLQAAKATASVKISPPPSLPPPPTCRGSPGRATPPGGWSSTSARGSRPATARRGGPGGLWARRGGEAWAPRTGRSRGTRASASPRSEWSWVRPVYCGSSLRSTCARAFIFFAVINRACQLTHENSSVVAGIKNVTTLFQIRARQRVRLFLCVSSAGGSLGAQNVDPVGIWYNNTSSSLELVVWG